MNQNNDDSLLNGIKKIAYNNINYNVENKLIKWWTSKYQLPPTDERLLAYTLEDLLIEYYEDVFLDDPKQMSDMMTKKEIEEIKKEDDSIPDVNPVFVKCGKKVNLDNFKIKK